jgi:hypothetical protein
MQFHKITELSGTPLNDIKFIVLEFRWKSNYVQKIKQKDYLPKVLKNN